MGQFSIARVGQFIIAANIWEGGFIGEGIVETIATKNNNTQLNNQVLNFKLYSLIDSLIKFLEAQGEENWLNGFSKTLNSMDNANDLKNIARTILRSYGGMGSFNDLVLHKNNMPLIQENDFLASLREAIFDTCTEIITRND